MLLLFIKESTGSGAVSLSDVWSIYLNQTSQNEPCRHLILQKIDWLKLIDNNNSFQCLKSGIIKTNFVLSSNGQCFKYWTDDT